MAEFTVTDIVDERTIKTSGWAWKNSQGNLVEVRGLYKMPDHTFKTVAMNRLDQLLRNKKISLINAEFTSNDNSKIICDVLLDEINIAKYFIDLSEIS